MAEVDYNTQILTQQCSHIAEWSAKASVALTIELSKPVPNQQDIDTYFDCLNRFKNVAKGLLCTIKQMAQLIFQLTCTWV